MFELEFARLSGLGLTPQLASAAMQAAGDAAESPKLARVVEVNRDAVQVHDGIAEFRARPLPRLLRLLADARTALAVGDWVLLSIDSHREAWVAHRVPPASHIVRRDGDGRRHPVVSNVDVALLVMGLDDDFNPRRLERYLALVHADGVLPVVVLTKRDVAAPTDAQLAARIALLHGRVPPHVDVLAVDATAAATAATLASYLGRGQTLVLLGSSGAGKSTLTNTLLGTTVQDTGAVRAHDGRGKHTTTSRSLHRLPGGACVIDTPGLRTLRPDGDATHVAAVFTDIEALAARCRFRDCRHAHEPECAVRDGVDADRLRNYHKLLRDARRDTQSALGRQQQVAEWKVRGRLANARIKSKRGEA